MARIAMLDSRAKQPINSALWSDGELPFRSDQLTGGEDFDVAIVGGGFSGLWSAFYLKQANPSLRVAIFEAQELGFGASGRNGGWVSSDFPISKSTLLTRHGEARTALLFQKLNETIDAIGEFTSAHAPQAAFVKSGTLSFARNIAQERRLRTNYENDFPILDRNSLNNLIKVNGARVGVHNPNSATVNPYQLLLALANFLRNRNVKIFTRLVATPISGGLLAGSHFVAAGSTIIATESFGKPNRDFIPLYSLMVATEPLPDRVWGEIGNFARFTFAEYSHLVNYAQRTSDGRLAIGGRGATYPFASRLSDKKEATEKVHQHIRMLACSWFPEISNYKFTHSWGGPVAITRDWEPYVLWDSERRIGRLGGYAGDGLSMSNLAARALVGEMLELPDSARELHFVGRGVRRWEREPLRYLAVNSLVKLSGIADREEAITSRPSILDRIIAPLILR